jgi:hypothetical protein
MQVQIIFDCALAADAMTPETAHAMVPAMSSLVIDLAL